MSTPAPTDPDDPAPDLTYDLAHEIPDQRTRAPEPVRVPPASVHVATRTVGYDGDYGYDLAHDVPGR